MKESITTDDRITQRLQFQKDHKLFASLCSAHHYSLYAGRGQQFLLFLVRKNNFLFTPPPDCMLYLSPSKASPISYATANKNYEKVTIGEEAAGFIKQMRVN